MTTSFTNRRQSPNTGIVNKKIPTSPLTSWSDAKIKEGRAHGCILLEPWLQPWPLQQFTVRCDANDVGYYTAGACIFRALRLVVEGSINASIDFDRNSPVLLSWPQRHQCAYPHIILSSSWIHFIGNFRVSCVLLWQHPNIHLSFLSHFRVTGSTARRCYHC